MLYYRQTGGMNNMSKALVGLAALGALSCAVGFGAAIWGTIETGKEHRQIPEIRETAKKDYESGNMNLNEYTVKIEELARKDVNLPIMEGLYIATSVIEAIGAGVCTWAAVESKDL